ncbi:GNAT family N-acetyltransferase [Halobacterium zhouii]|uniref:GNAT family N-acetyltransferase n=1 Tax=Halobacterium zhouii TaxID=2902624 RepID=UPI001E28EAE0|nr:GNAT family N-acetyltransferase [Halobacterium zhouii]
MAAAVSTRQHQDGYVTRPFERADTQEFLELYDDVFGGGSREWFEWKYENNPYADEIPVFVVEHETDGIVAARPQVPFEMRVNGRTVPAIRFGDTMVHEDHRRNGLFQRSTEHALEYYADKGVAFGFNFPNALSRPGYLESGGRVIAKVPTAYRVQNPTGFLDRDVPGPLATALRSGAQAILGARAAVSDTSGFDVERHDAIPAALLESLYERAVPPSIHASRDERFYGWRFENPNWEYHAYVARDGDRPVAGLVTGTGAPVDSQMTNVMEVMPLSGGRERTRALNALFSCVTTDHADSDTIVVAGRSVPESVLSTHGFLRDDRPPLSLATTRTRLVGYDVAGDEPWSAAGVDLTEPRNWRVNLSEHDTR